MSIPEYVKEYESLNSGDHREDVEERIAGNVYQVYEMQFSVGINCFYIT